MSNFKLTSNTEQKGKIVYNVGILSNIVAIAVSEVEGTVSEPQGKKQGISLYIEKDGVYVDVSVSVKYGYSVPELAYRIQQTVKQSVENMTHYKVAEVDVHVTDVVFCDAPALEKEEEDETGFEDQEKEEKEENNE